MGGVERKYGDVDLFHHAAEQRGRFERPQPLGAEIVAETVQLEEQQPERVLGIRPAGAQRVIALAQRGEHVRYGLQWPHDVLLYDGCAREPDARDQQREGPLRAGREVAAPEKPQGACNGREAAEQREPKDASLVTWSGLRDHAV